MSGNKYGMVIDFDSLTALLDILMDAGYKGDENARLLYLSITEAELFDYYLREKEQRENGGLKNFMPMESSKLKPREGLFTGKRYLDISDSCNHVRMDGSSFCVICGEETTRNTRNDAIYGKSKPVGRLTADGAMLEKCFQMEAHEKDD